MDAALAAGFDPTKKPFMFTAGSEEEETQTPVLPYAEMRRCIRDNKIADLDTFAAYCRRYRPDWTERLQDSETREVLNGYIRFLKLRSML